MLTNRATLRNRIPWPGPSSKTPVRWGMKLPFLPAIGPVIRSSPTKAAVPSLRYIITYST